MSSETPKVFDMETVKAHATRSDVWITIHNKIYNVTSFIEEHPGGEEVILELAGNDATEAFEDVGHSDSAKDLLKTFYVGDLLSEKKEDLKSLEGTSNKSPITTSPTSTSRSETITSPRASPLFLPLLILLLAYFAYRFYYGP
ncbi:hypothetical protein HMI54_008322 [Coelomomyces lativittatus]|nr:hypothetical protein HMI54_008322 [Coelomomyces lativittatus]KAJ1510131.1 hypothetical protein HMI56_006482 [Coelomomyces lativittatus]